MRGSRPVHAHGRERGNKHLEGKTLARSRGRFSLFVLLRAGGIPWADAIELDWQIGMFDRSRNAYRNRHCRNLKFHRGVAKQVPGAAGILVGRTLLGEKGDLADRFRWM